MTYETITISNPAHSSATEPEKVDRKHFSLEEIVETLKVVGVDIGQIYKLTSEEKLLVEQFFVSLQQFMPSLKPSIEVSPSALPVEAGPATHAQIDPKDT